MVLDLSTTMVVHGGYREYKNLFTMTLLVFTSPIWSARYVLSASWVLPQTERCTSVSIHYNVCSGARAGSFCSLWSTIYICRANDSPFLLISTGLLSGRSYQLNVTTESQYCCGQIFPAFQNAKQGVSGPVQNCNTRSSTLAFYRGFTLSTHI